MMINNGITKQYSSRLIPSEKKKREKADNSNLPLKFPDNRCIQVQIFMNKVLLAHRHAHPMDDLMLQHQS